MGTVTASTSSREVPPAKRRSHMVRWIAMAALVTGVGFVGVLATRPQVGVIEAASPLLGKQAPAVHATTLTGQPFDLSSDEGKWVLLTFFASWCPPCHEEQPELVAFYSEHRDDVDVVGVAYDDSIANAESFLKTSGALWPALSDPRGTIAYGFGVTAPPESFLISPTGVVEAHTLAPVTQAGLDKLLASLESGT